MPPIKTKTRKHFSFFRIFSVFRGKNQKNLCYNKIAFFDNKMNLQCSPVKLEAKDRSVKIGGYVLTETVRSSGKVIPPHYHEHTNISFVLFGSFIETIGNKPYELSPGSVVLRPAGEIHKNQYGATPTRSLIIEVSNQRLKAIRETSNLLDSVFHLRDSLMTNLALRIHHEFRQSDELPHLKMSAN